MANPMSPELMNELMAKIDTMSKGNVQPTQQFLPQEFLPRRERVLLNEARQLYVNIKELTTLDYVVIKNLLKNNKIEDDEIFQLYMIAQSIESVEFNDKNGQVIKTKLPQAKSIDDLATRMEINASYWLPIQEASLKLNTTNPETLGK